MREALNQDFLKEIYKKRSGWYDFYHNRATFQWLSWIWRLASNFIGGEPGILI